MNDHTVADDPLAWGEQGNCVGVDPDVFFPQHGQDTSRARSLCRTCPVRLECLTHALETNQKYGVWGGMTETQRRRLRRSHPSNGRRPAGIERSDESSPERSTQPVLFDEQHVDEPVRHLRLVSGDRSS